MQPQGHCQILCNIIDFGFNVQEAGTRILILNNYLGLQVMHHDGGMMARN